MDNNYKVIIFHQMHYTEYQLEGSMERVALGTTSGCEIRLTWEWVFDDVKIFLEQHNGEWHIVCGKGVFCTKDGKQHFSIHKLTHGEQWRIQYCDSGYEVFRMILIYDFEKQLPQFNSCVTLQDGTCITIGDSMDADMQLCSPYGVGTVVTIRYRDQVMYLREKHSPYGVMVNRKMILAGQEMVLQNCDFIGLADCFLYVKNGNLFFDHKKVMVHNMIYSVEETSSFTYPKFVRNTRQKVELSMEPIPILTPGPKPQKSERNLGMTLIPSIGMFLLVIIFRGMMNTSAGTYAIFSICSVGLGLFTTVLGIVQTQRKYRKEMARRKTEYGNYIQEKEREIQEARKLECMYLKMQYGTLQEGVQNIERFAPSLFERTVEDEDFLHVLLGYGSKKALRVIQYKQQEQFEERDELEKLPQRLAELYEKLEDVPIVVDLKEMNVIGITGTEEECYQVFQNLVLDVAIHQYHSDVEFYMLVNKDYAYCEWMTYLPQLQRKQGFRTIVFDQTSKINVLEALYNELLEREHSSTTHHHILVFVLYENDITSHPISRFLHQASKLQVTFLFFKRSFEFIPLYCDLSVSLSNKTGVLFWNRNITKRHQFRYETVSEEEMLSVSKRLSPIFCEDISLEQTLRKYISLFDLLGIYLPEDLNLHDRWTNSNIQESIAVPIGVNVKDEFVMLDLHEKSHGPHGLVAGTTGSGKSELLQSYILCAATMFSPQDLGFLIIDFKGGGMAHQFAKLPHLMGVITNMDGREMERSLKSIKAELRKRQRLFATQGVNHIDKYIQEYKRGNTAIAIPHLIIIIDEFAELKAEHPEFMKELISTARIGRSLGVHLILATQKPAGQINEQIWSNARFRLCLKVQNQEDSKEVLKSPLAAEIKEPGRAYLQVGNNEVFELFQSAYSGGCFVKEGKQLNRAFQITRLGPQGRTRVVYEKKKIDCNDGLTELEMLVNYISSYCTKNSIEHLSDICLPCLPDRILYENICVQERMECIPIGIYDAPDEQYQGVCQMTIAKENTLVIGSGQSGKTNLLQLCIRAIVERCSPKEAVFYIFDFGSMLLKQFERLKHVGGVVLATEGEKMKHFFKMILNEMEERRNHMTKVGVSSFAAYKEAGYREFPQIYILLDHFTAWREIWADEYEGAFLRLCREGPSLGIAVIVTNGTVTGMGYRYMSLFPNRICFVCNESTEYNSVFEKCRIEPLNTPGRFLFQSDKKLYEAQSYLAFSADKEVDRVSEIKAFIEKWNETYKGIHSAKRIPEIPASLSLDLFEQTYEYKSYHTEIPLGLSFDEIAPIYIKTDGVSELAILSQNRERANAFVCNLIRMIKKRGCGHLWNLYIIDDEEGALSFCNDSSIANIYSTEFRDCDLVFESILHEVQQKGASKKQNRKYIVVIHNQDCIEYISSNPQLLETYTMLAECYKNQGMQFIFSNVENKALTYRAPELLRRIREERNVIVLNALTAVKLFDIPNGMIRNHARELLDDEAFLVRDSKVLRFKQIKEDLNGGERDN